MDIQPVQQNVFKSNAKTARRVERTTSDRLPNKAVADSYEPAPADPKRLELLETIKKRIKSGFYNSDEVNEDLGHSLAKIFDMEP